MTHVQATPDQIQQGDQIQASQAEALKFYRMFRDGMIRDHGEYVGNGKVFTRLADDEQPNSRKVLIMLLMEAMRQLDAAGVPVDGIGVGGLDVI